MSVTVEGEDPQVKNPPQASGKNPGPASSTPAAEAPLLEARDLHISYGGKPAVRGVSLRFEERKITAIIGASGCGKSTLLRSFNRMNELIPGVQTKGEVLYRGRDIYARDRDPVELRRHIGMVFQRPTPFPRSILQNVVWGPKINGFLGNPRDLAEKCLRQAALWDEVKDKLDASGLDLSGGQQQRLCIARALAMEPDVILLDEPCSALDPISTARIEDLLFELKGRYTLVIVTHNMQQASRLSDFTAFMNLGELIEVGPTRQIFTRPKERQTEDYVTGKFG